MAEKWIDLFISITGRFGISLLNKFNRYKRRGQSGWTLYASVEEVYKGEQKEYSFDWIKEIDEGYFDSLFENEDDEEDFESRIRNQSVRYIKSEECLNEISEICFFYAAPDMILEHNRVLVFQDVNPWVLEVIMKEMVPHYKVVKQFLDKGKLREIQLSELKEESKELINDLLSKGLYPVVSDLYRVKTTTELTTGSLKLYSINKDFVDPLVLNEDNRIHQFIQKSSFQNNKPLVLEPVGWKLQDNLKNSITIRSFWKIAEQMVLLVNIADDSVRAIYIFGEKSEQDI
ncbi:hypothetical protein [Bacillus sp. ISL-77]|uniref:hypothetical protein n=1 Tax=Bacillus sp. ISL-77 TaxID=2819138 RepID=UPI001BEB7E69|nr:hypothetical protein [Bacillus sp. ISL-77]MBT2739374.1 hypothetical protein [Bacillus sp. ISL-77]